MQKGDIIYSEGKSPGSWWFVYGPENDVSDFTKNSVLVFGANPFDSKVEWPVTSWDDETIMEQGARIVPEDEVPDEVWPRVALYQMGIIEGEE